jgi:two-component system CAI-1 autoinducer sensor kinase/phosphatase CqsS
MAKKHFSLPKTTLGDRLKFVVKRPFMSSNGEGAQANRLMFMGGLALVCHPFYYWVWAYVFPQPYENVALRVTSMAWAVPCFFAKQLHRKKWFQAYFFAAITYTLPFFFTFMFLMNSGAAVWSQSLLVALVILLHFDGKFAAGSFTIGTLCAYLAYVAVTGNLDWPQKDALASLPIVAFAVLSISIVKIGRSILMEEKLHGMAAALGVISHELRTPLRSVDASARGLRRYLPALVEFFQANHPGASSEALSAERLSMMEPALERIRSEVRHMNSSIDLLLANTADTRRKVHLTQHMTLEALVVKAMERYPFESAAQRALVHTEFRSHDWINCNEDLGMMVLFNLFKNALHAIARAGKGEISVTTDNTTGTNRLIFRDTACGIPASQLPYIFRRFHAHPPGSGTGIGLAFVRDTLDAWGATISCHSKENEYMEFVIQFPFTKPPLL